MLTTLGELRRLVSEEVERNNRWSAGLFMAGGVSSNVRDREAILNPPPGLGDPGTDDEEDTQDEEERQEKSQAGARWLDRRGGARGPARV